jgi:hypothetical protein
MLYRAAVAVYGEKHTENVWSKCGVSSANPVITPSMRYVSSANPVITRSMHYVSSANPVIARSTHYLLKGYSVHQAIKRKGVNSFSEVIERCSASDVREISDCVVNR